MPKVRNLLEAEIDALEKKSQLPETFSITIPMSEILEDAHRLVAFVLSSIDRNPTYNAYDFTNTIDYIHDEIEKQIDEATIVAESRYPEADDWDLLVHINDFYAYNVKIDGDNVVIDFTLGL